MAAPEREDGEEEHRALEREKDDIVSAAVANLDDDTRLREALTFLLSALESAAFVDDAEVVVASLPATGRLLAACGPSSRALDAVLATVRERFPRTWVLVEESRLVEIDLARAR